MSDSPRTDCKGCCSQHNPMRSISRNTNGAYLSGCFTPCYCLCARCVTRENEIKAQIEAIDKEMLEEEANYVSTDTPS